MSFYNLSFHISKSEQMAYLFPRFIYPQSLSELPTYVDMFSELTIQNNCRRQQINALTSLKSNDHDRIQLDTV